ncbi:putative ABC-type nitrate/sulfonate/bicarbonate transport systems, periplasmic binding component [Desulfamplus magnetovallimortis]|uniref:Putative ABC-type nitrate/sulfonate/bicarbonate transport systems, periplasmic binding component n=1 Tax=Desulfamplus magnetovallimortis TaxID=1246637 RepID=A0A1W1H5D1_9BACT|nr:ABC transporter substrate-binding protein [Desulfamplus magnetovallimortis]SLM27662.1 putative ABC-type nitrate/sulfonate/bicarbonate transport systems, periplasmic binding component [Desulfamplus magnetovallimortis]
MSGISDIKIGYLEILDHLVVEIGRAGNKQSESGACPDGVDTVIMGSWAALTHALCEGDIQGAFIPLPEAMSLFSNGLDIKILLLDCRPGTFVVANRAAGVARLSDFKGKSVLLPGILSVYYLLFHRLMGSAGLRTGIENQATCDVFIEVVPSFMIPEMISCDIDGDIAGCMVEEPFASRIIYEGYGKKICHSRSLWPDHPHTALVMHDHVIDNHRSSVLEFVRWIAESNSAVYRQSPDLKFYLENMPDQKRSMMEKISTSAFSSKPFSLVPDIHLLEIINDFMVKEMGLLNSIIRMDDFVDIQFAVEAGA